MHDIVPIEKIEHFIQEIRKDKKRRIVFTNGCFDLLHRGHVQYLEQAKNLGDLLLIGLNSNASVARLKGNQRPYIDQLDRAFIISRLEAVDIVCVFDEDTPLRLIRKIKPDVLVKGGDYELDGIVGRDFVESYGGKVQTIAFINGLSSTNIIEKIKDEKND